LAAVAAENKKFMAAVWILREKWVATVVADWRLLAAVRAVMRYEV
jgi:hypothetical protein